MALNVLLVEDNPGDARLVREALKEAGNNRFKLDCTVRLAAGFKRLRQRKPDAILLDLSLPDSVGLETFARMRARAPEVPIVVLTGLKDEELGMEAMHQGAQDYLLKSQMTGEVLVRALLYAIERWQIEAALRKSEERYRALVEATSQVVWTTNARGELDGDCPAWRALTGQTLENIKGWGWTEAIHPEDRPQAMAAWRQAFKTRAPCQSAFRVRRHDGEFRYFVDHRVPVLGPEGAVREWIGTSTDITEQKQAEEEIRELPGRLLQAQDEERGRIARELHDSTAQNLTAVVLALDQVKEAVKKNKGARKYLTESIALVRLALGEIRNISYLLHPPFLDFVGLPAVLAHFVDKYTKRTGIPVDVEISPEFGRLPKETEETLFRVAQESLSNIHRHSGSKIARIVIVRDSTEVTLEVADRGRGMPSTPSDPLERMAKTAGIGIPSMRERAKLLGGNFEIETGARGTTVRVRLPVAAVDAASSA